MPYCRDSKLFHDRLTSSSDPQRWDRHLLQRRSIRYIPHACFEEAFDGFWLSFSAGTKREIVMQQKEAEKRRLRGRFPYRALEYDPLPVHSADTVSAR